MNITKASHMEELHCCSPYKLQNTFKRKDFALQSSKDHSQSPLNTGRMAYIVDQGLI